MLHNLCIQKNVPLVEEDDDLNGDLDLGMFNVVENENAEFVQSRQNQEVLAGHRYRQNIVNRFFSN